MAEKLTKRAVDRLIAQADPERDTLVWDAGVPGLVQRLRSGSARFAFQYKRRGRTRRITIGAYGPLTLDQARTLYAKIRAGTDSAEEKRSERAKRVLFAEMAAAYIADLRDRAARGVKRGRLSTAAEFERLPRPAAPSGGRDQRHDRRRARRPDRLPPPPTSPLTFRLGVVAQALANAIGGAFAHLTDEHQITHLLRSFRAALIGAQPVDLVRDRASQLVCTAQATDRVGLDRWPHGTLSRRPC